MLMMMESHDTVETFPQTWASGQVLLVGWLILYFVKGQEGKGKLKVTVLNHKVHSKGPSFSTVTNNKLISPGGCPS